MRRQWCMGVLVAATVALAAALAWVFQDGISAKPPPGPVEVAAARGLRGLLIPAGAKSARNPLVLERRQVEAGLVHFADHCASCHGNDGSGETPLGRGLYPRAPDMRGEATQSLTDGELFYIIENGVRLTGMPAWGIPGRPEETWKLVHFIRHLPGLTAEEKAEMRGLNPRGPEEWRELQEEDEFLRSPGAAGMKGGHDAH